MFRRDEQNVHAVIVVAANRFFRDSLGELIQKEPNLRLLGTGEFSPGMMEQVAEFQPDVVVLSTAWHDTEFQATRSIHDVALNSKILMIGMENSQETFLKAARAGMVGYLLKEASAEQIVAAIGQLAQDTFLCPSHLLRALFEFAAMHPQLSCTRNENGSLSLTQRESELISMVGEGLSNKEIANRLNLSEHTIKNHVHNILRKTGARTRTALTHLHPMNGT